MKKPGKKIFYVLPLLFFGMLVLIAAIDLTMDKTPKPYHANLIKEVPAFDIDGLAAADFGDQPVIVNFFASWCTPCMAEHPVISSLANDTPVYGINFMDTPEGRESFLSRLGNPYRKIGIDDQGLAAAAWGISGIPVTFLVHKGKILYRYDGPVTPEDADAILRPRLREVVE